MSAIDLLFILLILTCMIAALVPPYLDSVRRKGQTECSIRLFVLQEAKKDVRKDMNLLLPPERRLQITDRLNPLHLDKIARISLSTPWRFRPDDPCPLGGTVSAGTTFLDPPSCSLGHAAAEGEALFARLRSSGSDRTEGTE